MEKLKKKSWHLKMPGAKSPVWFLLFSKAYIFLEYMFTRDASIPGVISG